MSFEYDPKISFGNIVTVGVVLAGIIASFAVAQYQIADIGRRMERMQSESSEKAARLEMSASAYESRIRAVEIAQASQTSDLRSIQAGINEIKDQMRRLTPQP